MVVGNCEEAAISPLPWAQGLESSPCALQWSFPVRWKQLAV